MQFVIQQEPSGCGLAACAALAGLSYDQIKTKANAMGIFAEDKALWSQTDYVRKLLAEFDIALSPVETPFDSWQQLPDKALLAIKWHKEHDKPFWHWVVFSRVAGEAVVLDSKKSTEKAQTQRLRAYAAKWYIAVLD